MTALVKYDTWYDHASCKDYDHTVFFPEIKRGHPRGTSVKEAKNICAKCPVSHECFTTAFQNNEEYGIWAGVFFNRTAKTNKARNEERIKKDYIKFLKWKVR